MSPIANILSEKIGVLGEGVTAKAVKETMTRLHIPIVDLNQATVIVTSPGIPPNQFPKYDVEWISEIDLAVLLFHHFDIIPTIIAVTGTNGKTTVTSWISHLIQAPAFGNIGIPLISAVDPSTKYPAVVVEVSSYQIEQSHYFAPDISVILNITPDHLERHGTMEEYATQKARLLENTIAKDHVIYLENDPYIRRYIEKYPTQKVPYSLSHPLAKKTATIQLKGNHNQENAIASYLAAQIYGLPTDIIDTRLATFSGVEHRIEPIPNPLGIEIYNDSKATNPDSTIVAINAFAAPIHLILCGYDTQLPLEPLIDPILAHVKSIIVFGEIKTRFISIFNSDPRTLSIPVHQCDTLQEAIQHSLKVAQKSEIILFSPSCSSFDQFQNYEDRGRQFKQEVQNQVKKCLELKK
jgi:UDP-N-acetylmuramoylalanine--D-glutamate ligase